MLDGYPSVMLTIVDAVYEDGKLALQQRLPLPEHAHHAFLHPRRSFMMRWIARPYFSTVLIPMPEIASN